MTTDAEDENQVDESPPGELADHSSEKRGEGGSRGMSVHRMIHSAGGWLAVGALLVVGGLAIHPPPSPDPAVFMATIAEEPTRWLISHYASAIGFALWIVAGLLVLSAGSALTREWWTASAWALLVVGSVWVMLAWLVEATVVIDVAVAEDAVAFERWQAFIGGLDLGFIGVALGIAAMAVNEALAGARTTPAWAAWVGALVSGIGVITFGLALGAGIALAGPVWLVSSIVMGLWVLWFGIALVRSEGETWTVPVE